MGDMQYAPPKDKTPKSDDKKVRFNEQVEAYTYELRTDNNI